MIENELNSENAKAGSEITPGQRLEIVILRYFGKQKTLAEKVGLAANTISKYISGNLSISKATAMRFQDSAGINANYLLNGIEPMILNEEQAVVGKDYPIRFRGDAPMFPSEIKKKQAEKTHNRGMIKQYIHVPSGRKKYLLSEHGEVNIIDVVVDGIKEPIAILMNTPDFCKKYNLNIGSILIMNEFYEDGDIVFVAINEKHYIAELDNDILIDIADDTEIIITDDIKIIGSVYSKVERF